MASTVARTANKSMKRFRIFQLPPLIGSPICLRSPAAVGLLARLVREFGAVPLMAFFRQSSPIGGSELLKLDAWCARLGRVPRKGDLVARLQDIFAQARHRECMRIPQLRAPMFDATLVIGHVEQNAAMGVGPNPFG